MTVLFNYFDSILERGQVRIPYDENNRRIFLSEGDPQSDLQKVEITGFNKNSRCLAFRMDGLKKSRKTHLFLRTGRDVDVHKGCDGVLILQHKGHHYIVCCELKSQNPRGYTKQIQCSQAFVDYLCSLAKRLTKIQIPEFKRVNVLFTTRAFADKPTIRPSDPEVVCIDGHEYIQEFCDPNKTRMPSFHVNRLLRD